MKTCRPVIERPLSVYEPDLIQTLPATGLRALRIDLVAADVAIESCERSDVRILASGIREYPQVMPLVARAGETLCIDGETETAVALLHQLRRVKLIVQVPPTLNV